ncbi:hypothetical protein GN958_ATG02966 [Phytophthora infestans]|uniref:Uncharacterized protein n=1 Tax=Phytophthora infestans TaxID=4787 RepID=A0A8S9V5M9_PHYIN|nr:hypothetical protein GN958_ATG02966 [Phytophthora infestans]
MTTTNYAVLRAPPPEVHAPQEASAVVLASPHMPISDATADQSPERQRNLASEFEDIDSGSEPSHDAAEDAQDSEGDDFTPAVSADEESNGDAGIVMFLLETLIWSKLPTTSWCL